MRIVTQGIGVFKNISDSGNLSGKLFQINEVKNQLMDYQTQVDTYQSQIAELHQIIDNNKWNSSNLWRKIKTILKRSRAK